MKPAISLVEILVAMAVFTAIALFSIYGIQLIQSSDRDSQRINALAAMANQVNNYRKETLRYPNEEDIHYQNNTFTIEFSYPVELEGAARPSAKTTNSSTKYRYQKKNSGFALCAKLESGKVENIGTVDCDSI